jgi:hypothetical protein
MNKSSRVTLKPPLPLPSRLENKKDKCSHLVIWTDGGKCFIQNSLGNLNFKHNYINI